MRVKFGPWAPDAPDLDNSVTEAFNVMPYGEHYRPFLGATEVSDALAAAPIAGISTSRVSGSSETVVATLDKLYLQNGVAWDDKTGVAPTTESPMVWDFAQFNDYILAASFNNVLRQHQVGSGANFTAITDSPKARVVGVVREFVVCGDINDPSDGIVNHRVRWGSIGDPITWYLAGTANAIANQSDEQDLTAANGSVLGIFGTDIGIVFQERAITKMTYVGAPLVFRFDVADNSRGLRARKGAVQVGNTIYFLASDGFFKTTGTGESAPIGDGLVDRWFFDEAIADRLDYVHSVHYPLQKCVAWFFSCDSSITNDCALIYNYASGRWAHGDADAVIALTGRTSGYTIDNIDSFGTLDTITTSLDDQFWQGGNSFPAVFTSDYKLASLNGDPLEAVIETGSFGLDGQRQYISGVRPLVEGGDAYVTLGTQGDPSDAVTWGGEQPITSSTRQADFRSSAFFHRVRTRIPGGFTKTIGLDAVSPADGGRR